MTRRIVDRGTAFDGINRTLRDNRLPASAARVMENFRLPDKRLVRRRGFSEYSSARVHGNELCKTTPTTLERMAAKDAGRSRTSESWWRSPMSYGLLRWHDDFQPKIASAWSVEFLLTLGEKEAFVTIDDDRASLARDGSNNPDYRPRNGQKGVYVYDQTILANDCTFDDITIPGTNHEAYDTVSLPALSISYRADGSDQVVVQLGYTLVNTNSHATDPNEYVRGLLTRTLTGSSYAAGTTYHVAVTYDGTNALKLYVSELSGSPTIDATPASATLTTTNRVWAGEQDCVNNLTASAANAIQRDIVLLNEATVRLHYSSSCAYRGDGNQSAGNTAAGAQNVILSSDVATSGQNIIHPNPLAFSPPRGTGMSELRIWDDERTSVELGANLAQPIETSAANLVGYWRMNDGGGFIRDQKGNGSVYKNITLHHVPPQWVKDDGLLHDIGLSFADGQYLIRSYGPTDYKYISDTAGQLRETLRVRRAYGDPAVMDARSDFTVQMQFRTPHTFQSNLAKHGTAADSEGLRWWDGTYNTSAARVGCVDNVGTAQDRDDPFYSTLFSIEGVQDSHDSNGTVIGDDINQWTRVPLVQGLVDTDGKLAFRVMANYTAVQSAPTMQTLTSTTTLTADTVYVVTFRKLTEPRDSTGAMKTYLEVFIDGTKDGSSFSGFQDSSFAEHNLYALSVGPDQKMLTEDRSSQYDIIIGASGVNDARDNDLGNNATDYTVEPPRLTTGPQHAMGNFGDQPGFFILGFFRMWGAGISDKDIARFGNESVKDQAGSESLIFNLELEQITGDQVSSKGRYADVFDLGYKSFGASYQEIDSTSPYISDALPACPMSWSMEDCLGYQSQNANFDNDPSVGTVTSAEATVRGLVPFSSTLEQSSGLLAVMDNAARFDDGLTGTFQDLRVVHGGLLGEFGPGQDWEGVTIADRAFLVGTGGVPKVFDGKLLRRAGRLSWRGGQLRVVAGSGGSLESGRWYGFVVAFVSESTGVIHSSHRIVFYLASGSSKVELRVLPDHPDPSVTAVYVYRTLAQQTRSLAESAPVSLVFEGAPSLQPYFGDDSDTAITIQEADSTLFPAVLPDRLTKMPSCSRAASSGGRLWLAGDLLVPDAVYWSDPGSPERFDVVDNRLVLEESKGDRVNALVPAFGAVFAFKANSIWRIDEVGPGQMRAQRIAEDLGAISHRSIQLLTIPESGRSVIFFWSKHGPYLFDGSNFSYIGFPLEEHLSDPAYNWIGDPTEVFTLHEVGDREIICFYDSEGDANSENADSRVNRAVAYDYRLQTWKTYTGLFGRIGLTMIGTTSGTASGPQSFPEAASLSLSSTYLSLFGGTNGHVYRWGQDASGAVSTDGRPSTGSGYGLNTIDGLSSNTLTVSAASYSQVRGLWATVVKYDATTSLPTQWFSVPILDSTATTLVLDTSYWDTGNWPFTPTISTDKVLVGLPPAYLVLPWDDLELPFYDKQIERLVTWHDQDLYFRYARDWDEANVTSWALLSDPTTANSRNRQTLNRKLEAVKLYLMSLDASIRLDNWVYEVAYTREIDRDE